eukprot:s152_g8.t1
MVPKRLRCSGMTVDSEGICQWPFFRSGQHLANCLLTLSRLSLCNEQFANLQAALQARLLRRDVHFEAQHLANSLYALAGIYGDGAPPQPSLCSPLPGSVVPRLVDEVVQSGSTWQQNPQLLVCDEEDPRVSVGDVLAFLHSEILGTAASLEHEAERMHMMAQADLNPDDDKIRQLGFVEDFEPPGCSVYPLATWLAGKSPH